MVLLLQQEGRIIGSGDRVESPLGYLAEIRDTLVVRVEIFFSWDATLEAAGRAIGLGCPGPAEPAEVVGCDAELNARPRLLLQHLEVALARDP